MKRSFLVAVYEFREAVGKKSFWFMTLLFPILIIALSFGNAYLGDVGTESLEDALVGGGASGGIGYVDRSGIIRVPSDVSTDLVRQFSDEAAANRALEDGEIASFYVVPPDLVDSKELALVQEEGGPILFADTTPLFDYVLAYSFMGETAAAAAFVDTLSNVVVRDAGAPAGAEAEAVGDEPARTAAVEWGVPIFVLFILFFVLAMSSSYLLQSVTREKENRTAEVLLLSVTPRGLMAGKVAGLGAVSLAQVGIWIGGGFVAFWRFDNLPDPGSLGVSWSLFVWFTAYLLLGFVAFGSILAALGALVPSQREGAQLMFVVLLPLMLPLWLNHTLISDPEGILALLLSLFPLTAPVAMVARLAAADIPVWQPFAGLAGLGVTAYLFVLVGARIFRADTLLSPAALTRSRVAAALRSRRV